MCLFTGIVNGEHDPLIAPTDLKTEGAHENGIMNVHQADFVVCEASNEVKQDCELQQEVQSVNGNISHETVASEDATNGCPCELKIEGSAASIQTGQALFLVKGWRTHLCRCPDCLRMYEQRGIGFLLDPDDTLQVLSDHFL